MQIRTAHVDIFPNIILSFFYIQVIFNDTALPIHGIVSKLARCKSKEES